MTEITMTTGKVIFVKETPEEIITSFDNSDEVLKELSTITGKIIVRLKYIVTMKEVQQ